MSIKLYSNQALLLVVLPMVLLSQDLLADNKQQLQDVRGQMQHVQADMSKKQQQRSEVQKELKATEKEIGRQNREMRKLDRDIATQRKRIRATKIQQELNRNSLESQGDFMRKQIRLAYTVGRQDRLKLLLNQRDPEMVGRLMVYHDYFNRRRTEQMDLVQATLKNLQQAEQVMLAEELKMSELQSKKKREKSALEKNRKGREKLIARLNKGITSDAERLKELKRDEARLQKLLVQIEKKAKASQQSRFQSKGSPFKSQKGKMPWPAKGKLKARFGSAKRGGLKWDGLFISGPEGREVKAVYDGKVVFADWLRGFGLMLILDHGGGYMTLYGHNQSLAKETGDLVRAEDVVAALGSSGGQSEPGVYFAMRYKGEPINPERWLR